MERVRNWIEGAARHQLNVFIFLSPFISVLTLPLSARLFSHRGGGENKLVERGEGGEYFYSTNKRLSIIYSPFSTPKTPFKTLLKLKFSKKTTQTTHLRSV